MSYSGHSNSSEYLCYGSMAIINSFTLTVHRSNLDVRRLQTSESDVYRCQILMIKVYPYLINIPGVRYFNLYILGKLSPAGYNAYM